MDTVPQKHRRKDTVERAEGLGGWREDIDRFERRITEVNGWMGANWN